MGSITSQEIIQYIDIFFLVCIALRGLIGFIRGTRKSIFYLIATLIIYIGGWIAMGFVVEAIMNTDIRSYQEISFELNGHMFEVTTVKELLTDMLSTFVFSGADLTNTVALGLVVGVAELVVRVVYFILLIVLSDTIFKILFDIIWLIVKPRGKVKKGFISRVGGLGIGAAKGAFLLLIVFFGFAGISSMISDVNETLQLTEVTAKNKDKYDLVMLGSNFVLLEEEKQESEIDKLKDQYGEYFDLIKVFTDYRTSSLPGKIYGAIKVNDVALDEYIFDTLFEVKVGSKDDEFKASIELRKELHTIALAFKELTDSDPNFITNISNGDLGDIKGEALSKAIGHLSDLELVRVVIPVGLEYVVLSDFVKSSNEGIADLLEKMDLEELKKLDYIADIQSLGYVFVDALDLVKYGQGVEELSVLDFDPDTVKGMFDKLGELGVIDAFTPIVINYILTSDEIKKSIDNLGLDSEEVLRRVNEIESWGGEVSKLGVILSKVLEVGLDGSSIKQMDFSGIKFNKVEDLVEAIFDSQLMNEALPIFVDFGMSKLGEQYTKYIKVSKDTDWEKELTPLIDSALVLVKAGLVNQEALSDLDSTFNKLSDDVIEELGYYLSKSDIVTNGLNGLITDLLSGDDSLLNGISVQGFTDEEMKNGEAWTEQEITSIFKSAKGLISTGILTSDDMVGALQNLSSEKINEVSHNLSNSKFFKRNLSNILSSVLEKIMEGSGIEITALQEQYWTEKELSSIFNTINDFVNLGVLGGDVVSSIKNISDEEIDRLAKNISNSAFITRNFGSIIDYALSSADLGFTIEGLKDSNIWTRKEISSLFKASRTVLDYTGDDKEIIDILFVKDNDVVDSLLESKIISKSIGSFIKSNVNNSDSKFDLSIIKGTELIGDDEWSDITHQNVYEFTVTDNIVSINNYDGIIASCHPRRIDVYYRDQYLGKMDGNSFDLTKYIGVPGDDNDYLFESAPLISGSGLVFDPVCDGEIRKIFNAFSLIADGAYSDGKLDSSILIKNLTSLDDEGVDKLCASIVLSETIKEYLTGNLGSESNGLVVNLGSEDNLADELKPLLKAIKLLFGENIDINTLEFEANEILTNLVTLTNDINATPGSVISRVVKTKDSWHINYNEDNSDLIFAKFNDLGLAEVGIGTEDVRVIINGSSYDKKNDKYNLNVSIDGNSFVIEGVEIGSSKYKEKNSLSGYAIELQGKLKKDETGKCYITNVTVNSLIDYNNYVEEFVNADQVGDILRSKIIKDTLKKFITDAANKESSSIKLPEGVVKWEDSASGSVKVSGELRKLFTSLQLLFPDGNVDISNIALNTLFDRSDEDLNKFLESGIITETIKDIIIKLDTRNEDGSGDTTIFVNKTLIDTKGWNKEIVNMIKAVKFVLGEDADLNSATADINKVMMATDDEVSIILDSIIVSDTLIKTIYDQSDVNIDGTIKGVAGAIKIPKNGEGNYYSMNDDFWKDGFDRNITTFGYDELTGTITLDESYRGSIVKVYKAGVFAGYVNDLGFTFGETFPKFRVRLELIRKGEVRKIFDGIQTMFETIDPITHKKTVNVDFDNIKVDTILEKDDNQVDKMLDSEVLAYTIKDYIKQLDTRNEDGTGSTTIYVNEENIVSRHVWGDEIKALLKSFKLAIEPDGEGKYSLDNASSIDINALLAPENKEKLLDSVIISDTLIANLESNSEVYTRTGLDWYGTTGFNGELGKFIDAANLVLKDDSGNIDISHFSEENLTSLTNDISAVNKYELLSSGHYADEIGILVSSTILRDTIASHILDLSSIELVMRETEVTKDSYWNDNGATPGEIRSLLTSLNILLDGAKLSEFVFDMNTILGKSKSQINTAIAGSDIISGTVANTLTNTLYGGSLDGLINDAPVGLTRMEYVENDQVNLIYVFKDLNEQFGINYDQFNFSSFQSAIACDSDAYFMAGILCESDIIESSISTMFKKIINDNSALTTSNRTAIMAGIDSISTWDNPQTVGDDKEFGELALMFRALETLNTFGDSASSLDASSMKEPLQRLNASRALQPIIPEVLDKALDSVDSWKKSGYALTPIEWDQEIEVLKDLINYVQNDLGGNLSGVTNASDIGGEKLEDLIVFISESRILDVNNINNIVRQALESSFGSGIYVDGDLVCEEYSSNLSGTMLTTINSPLKGDSGKSAVVSISGYSNIGYDNFVSNWAVEAHALNLAITQLGKIEFSKITNFSMTTDEETGVTEFYYINVMRNIGRFLDKCEDTKTLKNSVSNVANNYGVSKGVHANWELAFVATASLI